MAQLFANAARAYLSAGIAAGDTTISISSGGALFPVANGTDWFKAVLQDASGIEIVYVTVHTSGSTSFTVTRGQEGTTARSFAAGSVFGVRVTSADMAGFAGKLSDAPSDGKTYGRKDAAWSEITSGGASYQTGDSLTTSRTLSTPDWVEAGKVYLQSSYPALYALAGDRATSIWGSYSTDQGAPPSAICAASSTTLVSVGGGGASTRSEDAGASWARVTGPNTTDFFNAVCAASSTIIVAVGDAGVVWRSTNAGAFWTKITGPNTTDRLQSVAALTSTALIAVGQSGVVWTSATGGGSWTKITGPNTTDNLISVVALSSTVAVAVSTLGAQWKTTNAGASWTRTVAATGVSLNSVCALDANTLVAVGSVSFTNTSIIRSADAGASWTVITPINATTNLRSVTAFNATDVIAVGYRGVIWRSKDAGATWFSVGEFEKPSRSASLTCVTSTSGNLAVAAGVDNTSLTSVVWRAGGFQHNPATQFVTPYTGTAQAGLKQYIKV